MAYVQVVIGRCPICGALCESAEETGLDGLWCARGHVKSRYLPADTYYMEEADTWIDRPTKFDDD